MRGQVSNWKGFPFYEKVVSFDNNKYIEIKFYKIIYKIIKNKIYKTVS